MSGQSLGSALIAAFVIAACIVAAIIVHRNFKIKFSFKIIGLVAMGSLATIVFQILQESDKNTPFTVIGQGVCMFFMEMFIPMSIIFTKRQWTLLKRYQIKHSESKQELNQLKVQLMYVYKMFGIFLKCSLTFIALYAIFNTIYFYFALLVDPCNTDIG